MEEATVDLPEIDVAEAAERHAAGTPVIDVREPWEYLEGHVPGATLIPMAELQERIDEVPTPGEVMVICAVGSRSRRVAEFLRAQGIDAVNIVGGTMGWIDEDLPVVVGEEAGT
jgi:rhodanese-related sulfurtransferase